MCSIQAGENWEMGLVFLSPESNEKEVIYPCCLGLHLGGTRSSPLPTNPLCLRSRHLSDAEAANLTEISL